jgi:hypothetical protein
LHTPSARWPLVQLNKLSQIRFVESDFTIRKDDPRQFATICEPQDLPWRQLEKVGRLNLCE